MSIEKKLTDATNDLVDWFEEHDYPPAEAIAIMGAAVEVLMKSQSDGGEATMLRNAMQFIIFFSRAMLQPEKHENGSSEEDC